MQLKLSLWICSVWEEWVRWEAFPLYVMRVRAHMRARMKTASQRTQFLPNHNKELKHNRKINFKKMIYPPICLPPPPKRKQTSFAMVRVGRSTIDRGRRAWAHRRCQATRRQNSAPVDLGRPQFVVLRITERASYSSAGGGRGV
jgi:hypothetical protein